jgi:hypothetical protein
VASEVSEEFVISVLEVQNVVLHPEESGTSCLQNLGNYTAEVVTFIVATATASNPKAGTVFNDMDHFEAIYDTSPAMFIYHRTKYGV